MTPLMQAVCGLSPGCGQRCMGAGAWCVVRVVVWTRGIWRRCSGSMPCGIRCRGGDRGPSRRGGHDRLLRGRGHQDRRAGLSRTRFGAGSLTKSMVATVIAGLAEAGRLSLDDRVAAHVPELRASGWAGRGRSATCLRIVPGLRCAPGWSSASSAGRTKTTGRCRGWWPMPPRAARRAISGRMQTWAGACSGG
jgi:hypothetical protein